MKRRDILKLVEVTNQTGPDDEFPNETVIRFKHSHDGDTVWYTYIAFKVRGKWYLTGRVTTPQSWDQLVAFMGKGRTKGVRISNAGEWARLEQIADAPHVAATVTFPDDTFPLDGR